MGIDVQCSTGEKPEFMLAKLYFPFGFEFYFRFVPYQFPNRCMTRNCEGRTHTHTHTGTDTPTHVSCN